MSWQEAIIARIEPRTPGMISVFLRSPLAQHLAGQHLDVQLTAPDGYRAQRKYSIASLPGSPELELAIELLPDGEVSSYFHEIAQPGDALEVRGPLGGHFVWTAAVGGPLLLIAGGSGVAPLLSIARERAARAADVPALLLYSARSPDALFGSHELQALAARDAAFRFVATTTRQPPQRAGDYARRIDRPLLREVLAAWGQIPQHSYVCGSTPFVEAVTGALVQEGVPSGTIRAERYGASG